MVEVDGLERSYGSKPVLRGLTFSIAAGEIYGLLGPNGAGKTTLIHVLCNVLDADAGAVRIGGKPGSDATRRLMGVVPQEISLYLDLTCEENLDFFGRIYGLSRNERQARTEALIETFRLDEYRRTAVSRLSGGWQRRLNIAVALMHEPPLLILDEPTAGLDVESRYELWQTIETLAANGVTVLLTTHQLEEADRLCTRVGILQDGRIVAEGSLGDLRRLVPARLLAMVESGDEASVCRRAATLGWSHRRYGGRLALLLPEPLSLTEVVDRFDDVKLSGVALQSIGLEHVYVEVTATPPRAERQQRQMLRSV